jgi:hypothetical protein
MATREEINSFTRFAIEQLQNGGADRSMDELYDLWRSQHPSSEELLESVAAVRAALADMNNGDKGIPAEEHLARLRSKYKLAESE